jgi:predicted ATP-grasp superfamily ATP-dependent carboligase
MLVAPGDYPDILLQVARKAPACPWMYTGALENRPDVIRALAHERPLWGNDESVLVIVRSPRALEKLFAQSSVSGPRVQLQPPLLEPEKRWLVKPLASAGGSRIRFWTGGPIPDRGRFYFQEYVPGERGAAIYVADGRYARLLGVTRQLIGESWLHAAPFHYCGSIGPLALTPAEKAAFQRLGDALMAGCALRGLFGIDCIWHHGAPWPTEVNPRYTASVEVVEHAACIPALALHGHVFDASIPQPPSVETATGLVVGKAILFARAPLVFPKDGPWTSVLQSPGPLVSVPAFADIPPAGQAIGVGRPILTLFAQGASPGACMYQLQQIAADLDRWLFER